MGGMLRGRKRDSISPWRLGSLPKVGRRRTYLAVCRYTPNASCRAQFRTSRCGRYVSPKLASEITSGRNLSSLSICSNSAPSSTTEAKKKVSHPSLASVSREWHEESSLRYVCRNVNAIANAQRHDVGRSWQQKIECHCHSANGNVDSVNFFNGSHSSRTDTH